MDAARYLSRARRNKNVSDGDLAEITKYIQGQLINDRSHNTVYTESGFIDSFFGCLPKPLTECSTEDVLLALVEYRKTHKPTTFHNLVAISCRFLKSTGAYPDIDIERIRAMKPRLSASTKRASEMLTSEEIERLINATRHPRDRALLAVLYEGGFRPCELSALQWCDVNFDNNGATVTTAGKTEKQRYIRLVWSVPMLAAWRQMCPEKGAVFPSIHRKDKSTGITRDMIYNIFSVAVKEAGFDKRAYPYLFRHSRVTHLLEDGLSESVIKMVHWGTLRTPMLATYGHMSNQAIDKAILEHAGVEIPRTRGKASPKPIQCQNCKNINVPGSIRCGVCGMPFTPVAVTQGDEIRNWAMAHPEILWEALEKSGFVPKGKPEPEK